MMHFVAFFQPAQDGNGGFDGGLTDIHLLKPALKCWVLLDVLAILIECRGADHAQLAASEHRLDHVSRIHCAFGTTSADEGVQFVDERDDFTFCIGDLFQHGFQTFFELTAIFGSRQHRTKIETDESLGLQTFWHVSVGDTTREAFDNCCLPDSRFTDENRVVLRTA